MLFNVLTLLLTADAADPALIDRLEAHAERLGALEKQAGDVAVGVKSNELDDDGKVKKSKVIDLIVHHREGPPTTTLTKFLEDGEDVTEKKREEIESKPPDKRRGGQSMAELSPFSKEARAKYTFSMLSPPSGEAGFVRIAIAPRGEKDSELMMGDAVVDPANGEVVKLSLRPSKNPPFVDSLSFECDFDDPTAAGRGISRIRVKGAGGFAFIRKRFDAVTTIHRLPAVK